MPTDISEKGLETILVDYLRDKQGYEQGTSHDYSKDFGVDTERVKRFILSTQKQKAESTACFASPIEERKFFARMSAELTNRGVSEMLRKGFRYISEVFDLYYSLPSELNPRHRSSTRRISSVSLASFSTASRILIAST